MAKNKSSKFGVADNLQYRDEFKDQPDFDIKKFLDNFSNLESSSVSLSCFLTIVFLHFGHFILTPLNNNKKMWENYKTTS